MDAPIVVEMLNAHVSPIPAVEICAGATRIFVWDLGMKRKMYVAVVCVDPITAKGKCFVDV